MQTLYRIYNYVQKNTPSLHPKAGNEVDSNRKEKQRKTNRDLNQIRNQGNNRTCIEQIIENRTIEQLLHIYMYYMIDQPPSLYAKQESLTHNPMHCSQLGLNRYSPYDGVEEFMSNKKLNCGHKIHIFSRLLHSHPSHKTPLY